MDRHTINAECSECGNDVVREVLSYERFEQVIKDLDCAGCTVRQALRAAGSLDEKIKMNQMRDAIEKARSLLRPHLFAFEDAVKNILKVEA